MGGVATAWKPCIPTGQSHSHPCPLFFSTTLFNEPSVSKYVFVEHAVRCVAARGQRLTCCATVFADSDLEFLLDRCDLKVVVRSIGSLSTHSQVKPQLVLGRCVGELINLTQTWGNRHTESVNKHEGNSPTVFMCACFRCPQRIGAYQSRTHPSCCQTLRCTVSSASWSPVCQRCVVGAPESSEHRTSTDSWHTTFQTICFGKWLHHRNSVF